MSKEILGDACAYIAPAIRGGKARHLKLGTAMQDGDRLSLKLDTLPLPGSGWEGWINIFPPRDRLDSRGSSPPASKPRSPSPSGFDDMEDDIPF